MGFNKRYFSMEKLAMYYEEDPENGISNCIGKTDAFFFSDNESRIVIELWNENQLHKANKIIIKWLKTNRESVCI